MTTNDFIIKLRKLDFVGGVSCASTLITVMTVHDKTLAELRRDTPGLVDTHNYEFFKLKPYEQYELFKLCSEYALTPLDQREGKENPEEKRYRLVFAPLPCGRHCAYLNYAKSSGLYHIGDYDEKDNYQTTFTQAEIDAIRTKHGGYALDAFVQEEVKE